MRTSLLVAILLGLAACGAKPAADKAKATTPDTLTTRQRQEAIGNSGIPGARGINRALIISDTALARNQRLDSINQ